ncbi:MAG: hypothetical protein WCC22_08655 [Terriglobales bacterium]
MAKSKGNDAHEKNPGPVPHHKASDAHNAEADRLKRNSNHVQKLLDRQGND